MRIAHVVWGMKTGGVETMLVNIINEQVKKEEVRLFIINDFIDDFIVEKISSQCRVLRLKRKPSCKNPIKIVKLNYWICSYKPDVIHVHSYQVSKLIFGNWNIVRTIHGMNNASKEYPKMKALYSISNVVRDFTLNQGFQSKVIMNGINTSEMKVKDYQKSSKDIFELVQVSRLHIKSKGQDILLKALEKLVVNGIRNFQMHFIGAGPSENDLRTLAKSLGISDYVVFEGLKSQEYVYHHLCDYDIFIQSSRCEGFGLTVAEAMAAKLPVLVSNIEGPMEVIGYGEYGMSFKSENVDDLAEKLTIILQGGYDYSLVEKAYLHVCEEYDVSRTANEYITEYRKIARK